MSGSVTQLGEALHRLLTLPMHTQADLASWYEQADAFRRLLRALPPSVNDRLPHELEHFLSDADIRLKDERYADVQEAKMRALSDTLMAGVLPGDP